MAIPVSMFLFCLVGHLTVVDAGQTVVKDLRTTMMKGTNARFLVNREDCLRILQEKAPGMGLQLASEVHERQYDTNLFSEILVSAAVVMDATLKPEIDESTSSLSAAGQVLFVALPVVSKGAIIDLVLAAYSDHAPKKHLAIPYFTNYAAVKRVDAITVSVSDYYHVVKIQDGADQMVLRMMKIPDCVYNTDVAKDKRITNYPDTFDWGCDIKDFTFCERLDTEIVNEDIGSLGPHVEGNVCTMTTTTRSRRCPVASATIEAITGKFLNGLPGLAGTVPISAIEGELMSRIDSTGIIFPCIKP